MSIRFGDYCLSGRVWRSLEETAARLGALDTLVVEEACVVSFERERTPILLHGGGTTAPDLAGAARLEARLRMRTFASPLLLALFGGDPNEPPNTIVDCMLYLDQLLDDRATPGEALHELVAVMVELAECLGARWLHLACEDDVRLQLGGGLRLPDVCCIYRHEMIDDVIELLRSAGAIVDEPLVRGYRAVWMAPMEALLADKAHPLPERVHALLREKLLRLDAQPTPR